MLGTLITVQVTYTTSNGDSHTSAYPHTFALVLLLLFLLLLNCPLYLPIVPLNLVIAMMKQESRELLAQSKAAL
jgi:hypothetical protein